MATNTFSCSLFLNNHTRFAIVHYQISLYMICLSSEITNGL